MAYIKIIFRPIHNQSPTGSSYLNFYLFYFLFQNIHLDNATTPFVPENENGKSSSLEPTNFSSQIANES